MPLPIVPNDMLVSLAAAAPAEVRSPHAGRGEAHGRPFDIVSFIERHGLQVDGPDAYQGGRRWTFRQSPMCEHHGDGPYLIQFESGAIAAGCHHDSCAWGWADLRARYEPRRQLRLHTPSDNLPEILLPGGEQTITATGAQLGELLASRETHFLRGGCVTRVGDDYVLRPVRPSEIASDFELVAQLVKRETRNNIIIAVPATCSKSTAELILGSDAFRLALPELRFISCCPVLFERDGQLTTITGFDRASGILARGEVPEQLTLDDAVGLLIDMLADFQFATPGDQSRALAAITAPALIQGDLLPGRAPIDGGEADQSQSGKGYRNKLTAAIYGGTPRAVTMRKRGVGGLEESFDRALISGATLISVDNARGHIDSQSIESFMTEDTYFARTAYAPVTQIDPRRVIVMLTSNRADLTIDLANRSSCVRLLKRPERYTFRTFAEGDILDHVRAHQPWYLGAIFAVIRAWHAAGKPRTDETRHDFRGWAQTLDWIVRNIFGTAPLMDGHREIQVRMSNPALNWLRDVALAVVRQGQTGRWLIASQLLDVIETDGDIAVPGRHDDTIIEDEAARTNVLQQIGRRLVRAFGDSDLLAIDQLRIERQSYQDERSRDRHRYRVTRAGDDDGCGGPGVVEPGGEEESPDVPPDVPLMCR